MLGLKLIHVSKRGHRRHQGITWTNVDLSSKVVVLLHLHDINFTRDHRFNLKHVFGDYTITITTISPMAWWIKHDLKLKLLLYLPVSCIRLPLNTNTKSLLHGVKTNVYMMEITIQQTIVLTNRNCSLDALENTAKIQNSEPKKSKKSQTTTVCHQTYKFTPPCVKA